MKKWNFKKALVVFKEEASHPKHEPKHQSSLALVCAALQENGIIYKVIRREKLNHKIQEPWVITVGGDGTFLHASHFASSKHLLMGINSVPAASHGAFCVTDAIHFKKILPLLLNHKVPITPLSRLEVKRNGKKIPFLALNDVLFANPSPAGTSRYRIQVGSQKEEQKSSGVWISTPSGSSGAIRSAGGELLPKHSRQFQFLVREPFQQGKKKLKITHGIFDQKGSIKITPQMSRACVFIDGSHIHYELKNEGKVEVKLSNEVIWAVMR